MSAVISPATGKVYGVQRVCEAWEVPRSSFYGRQSRNTVPLAPLKRGPKTPLSDDEVLALIRADGSVKSFSLFCFWQYLSEVRWEISHAVIMQFLAYLEPYDM